MRKIYKAIFLNTLLVFVILLPSAVPADVQGPCSKCHTMSNSQDGFPMTYDDATELNSYLIKTGSCIGCHAQGGSSNIINFTPQVMHTDSTDLAGGNFAYINGIKGSGASHNKGHNVVNLCAQDSVHNWPPGGAYNNSVSGTAHPKTMPALFTCAGLYGCHGNPHIVDPVLSMQGAHHTSSSDKLTGETVGNSFRFLLGVTGLESDDWQNRDSDHHNEYKGDPYQLPGFPTDNSCDWCHTTAGPGRQGTGGVLSPGSSMADLCLRCHPAFHSYNNDNSAWCRHPTNVAIPDTGEYALYTVYNVNAPVARNVIPDFASPEVTPGRSTQGVGHDYVTCLSCHKAHATDYTDLLRWDYNSMVADGSNSGDGCFICHTSKDD